MWSVRRIPQINRGNGFNVIYRYKNEFTLIDLYGLRNYFKLKRSRHFEALKKHQKSQLF